MRRDRRDDHPWNLGRLEIRFTHAPEFHLLCRRSLHRRGGIAVQLGFYKALVSWVAYLQEDN